MLFLRVNNRGLWFLRGHFKRHGLALGECLIDLGDEAAEGFLLALKGALLGRQGGGGLADADGVAGCLAEEGPAEGDARQSLAAAHLERHGRLAGGDGLAAVGAGREQGSRGVVASGGKDGLAGFAEGEGVDEQGAFRHAAVSIVTDELNVHNSFNIIALMFIVTPLCPRSEGEQVGSLHQPHVEVSHVALHPCHGADDGHHGLLVLEGELLVGLDLAPLAHDGDVGVGAVAVFGRRPAVDDVVQGGQVVQPDVGAQDAEGSAEPEQQALELHELLVVLPPRLPQPAGLVTPADVQRVVVSFSSCHRCR